MSEKNNKQSKNNNRNNENNNNNKQQDENRNNCGDGQRTGTAPDTHRRLTARDPQRA